MTLDESTHGDRISFKTFATTDWSEVIRAGQTDSPAGRRALENLCTAYWGPLYCFVRRQGRAQHEAEDLVQGFFEQLLKRNDITKASPDKGRFRTFLLASLKNFLINDWRSRTTQKRNGVLSMEPLQWEKYERSYQLESAQGSSPDLIFDKQWALAITERVMTLLEDEYRSHEKVAFFLELKGFVSDKNAAAQAEVAKRRGITVNAVRVAIHRLRQRYAELLRNEIAQTVEDPLEIDDEIRRLIAVLGS
jgi:RNA polymerase sigma factor (sigma-70 family)